MLPHILHSTGRAVAVVHNQTHTIRNVLQLQSSGPSSGSGSSWGNGPGPGGAKYGAGSRFYAGHNSAGRAVAQANAVTSHDGQISQSDDIEEAIPKWIILPTPQRKRRMRSSSLSMGVAGRNERAEKLGVLKSVQLHARGKHGFAAGDSMAMAKERLLSDPLPEVTQPTQPLLVRRNSTSAPLSPLLNPTEPPIPPPQTPGPTSKQAEATQAEDTPVDAREEPIFAKLSNDVQAEIQHFRTLAATSKDAQTVAKSVRRILATFRKPPLEVYNAALNAMVQTRPVGSALTPIIGLYNNMLAKSILPNVETYEILIRALTVRDIEVHRAEISLDLREKQKKHVSREAVNVLDQDSERFKALAAEDNFASAMSLFEGVLAVGGKDHLQMSTFVRLMNCAANHADVHSAIHVFAQLEARQDIAIPVPVYRYLILTFSNAGQIAQAEETFHSFVVAGANNKLHKHTGKFMSVNRRSQIQVWNAMMEAYFRAGMPDKAIELVDRILKSDAGNNFTMADVPVATSSMFTTVIHGFLTTGDLQSAVTWFEKLLPHERAPQDPYQGLSGGVMAPDGQAWFLIMDHLADNGKLDALNRLFKVLKDRSIEDNQHINGTIRLIVYTANLEHLQKHQTDRTVAVETLKYLLQDLCECRDWDVPKGKLVLEMCYELVARGEFSTSTAAYINMTSAGLVNRDSERWSASWLAITMQTTSRFIQSICSAVHKDLGTVTISEALSLARLMNQLAMVPDRRFAQLFLHAYGRMANGEDVEWNLTVEDWQVLFVCASQFDINVKAGNPANLKEIPGFAFRGTLSLIDDFNASGHPFSALSEEVRLHVIGLVQAQHPTEDIRQVLAPYGVQYLEAADKYDELKFAAMEKSVVETANMLNPVTSQLLPDDFPALKHNPYLTQQITVALGPPSGTILPEALEKAFSMFKQAVSINTIPSTSALCRLIECEGRAKDLNKVRELYTAAQAALRIAPAERLRYEWAAIENSMIIALAHAGHVDAAHMHRLRILEQGLCPSADAYGILVQLVRDTTDDTSGAIALFEEALARGVKANMYLYNNIISKLSRARKADYALELFEQMKAGGINVSSITYGAVIGACARVGDVTSAESLFKEMVRSRNFKPRVPPYNTMMQLYTQTKPSRTSALYYYNEMKRASVKPSAHTYKLLLDTYGSLEPVDLQSMEKAFTELLANESVEVTGAHFASLINAYGCVSKDLDKAISVFESMGTYPRAPKPDAVAFEAIINAVVANKRTSLLPVFVNKLTQHGVHMTAYIANFLIKGYANVGDLDKARDIFESLSNPPTGVAAPNNHAPHSPELVSDVPVMSPVYREPSTWETMVRAELGAGNRDAALALLERLQERGYPEAVYNRISGILTDFSVLQ